MSDPKQTPTTGWQPREKGPVEILCDEIGFRFERPLETVDTLVAFVRMLVSNIEDGHEMQARIAHVTGEPPSDAAGRVLASAVAMLDAEGVDALQVAAATVHDLANELNPDDAYPTDHTIDMLSSCASAIRFGLETPCHSRHAAAAAGHVWHQRYGIRIDDELTGAWQKDWARTQLQRAIILQMTERAAA